MSVMFHCFLIAASLLQAGTTQAPVDEQNRPVVVAIFTEHNIRVRRDRDLLSGFFQAVDRELKVVSFGSGFLWPTTDSSSAMLVTAAHVIEFPSTVRRIEESGEVFDIDAGWDLDIKASRIRLGGFSLRPRRLLVDHDLDIAVMELAQETANLLSLRRLSFAMANVGDEVKIWGFPGIDSLDSEGQTIKVPSAYPVSQRCDVTAVVGGASGEIVCTVLNGLETRGGFSGGPVVKSDRIVGLVSRSTPETTRCRSVEAIRRVIARFTGESAEYSEEIRTTAVDPKESPGGDSK